MEKDKKQGTIHVGVSHRSLIVLLEPIDSIAIY